MQGQVKTVSAKSPCHLPVYPQVQVRCGFKTRYNRGISITNVIFSIVGFRSGFPILVYLGLDHVFLGTGPGAGGGEGKNWMRETSSSLVTCSELYYRGCSSVKGRSHADFCHVLFDKGKFSRVKGVNMETPKFKWKP